jgi:hypothetical protein
MKKLMQLVLMIMLVMGMSVASQAATITVGSATGDAGTQVSIPVTIDSTAGRLDCSFSVSFDNTKLEYAGKTSGDMGASLLVASTADINTAGKVQPIVSFEDGGATSGTIVSFKFNIKTGAAGGATPLTIGDITPTGTYTGVSGSVTINCTGPTITVGTDTACKQGDQVEIPITVDDIAGQPDLSFSVSFDKTKLQFTGTDTGTMSATILAEKTDEINATGKAQIIARFATGGATSGTIVKLKFTALAALTADLPLTLGDIIPSDAFCGEDGAVEQECCTVAISPTTAEVESGGFNTFTSTTTGICGTLTWSVTSTIGSTVTQNGLYHAGQTNLVVTDTVTVTSASTSQYASAVVTVTPPCTITIQPSAATVFCIETRVFTAQTTGTCGPFTWSVDSTIGSVITKDGVYNAGQNLTDKIVTDTITVASGKASATATVKVLPRRSIEVGLGSESSLNGVKVGENAVVIAAVTDSCSHPIKGADVTFEDMPADTTNNFSNFEIIPLGTLDITGEADATLQVTAQGECQLMGMVIDVNSDTKTEVTEIKVVSITPEIATVENEITEGGIYSSTLDMILTGEAIVTVSAKTGSFSKVPAFGYLLLHLMDCDKGTVKMDEKTNAFGRAAAMLAANYCGSTDTIKATATVESLTATGQVNASTEACPPCPVDLTLPADKTEAMQGETKNMKLTASANIFENVALKDITVSFGEGITSEITEVKSANIIKVMITIDANATIGTRTVQVTTPTNCAKGTFRVTPAATQ